MRPMEVFWTKLKHPFECFDERLNPIFKCIRVILYCSGNRIYVGEMTFWPMAGHYKGEGQKKMGRYLDFDRTTFKPFILPELEKSRSRFSIYPEA